MQRRVRELSNFGGMEGRETSSLVQTPQLAAQLPVHPAVAPLSYLLGTWRGQGEGGFPTIAKFKYGEELHFSHPGNKPVIVYSQKTWNLDSGEPMHAESGYWRLKLDGTLEVVIAQSTGLVEVQDLKTKEKICGGREAKGFYYLNAPCGRTSTACFAVASPLEKGTYDAEEKVVNLQSELVGNASKVREISRVFKLVNGELAYMVKMATNLTSLQPHLEASLTKL